MEIFIQLASENLQARHMPLIYVAYVPARQIWPDGSIGFRCLWS